MIDRKIPVNFKRQFLVLESGNEIVALPGWQISESFKVTGQSERVFILKIHAQSL